MKKNNYCPFCKKTHEVEVVKEATTAIVKDENVLYNKEYCICPVHNKKFETKAQENKNELLLKDTYKKEHYLLTSEELKAIRKSYDLTQEEFALILGWGSVTISRYESKDIQNEKYDKILRNIENNPYILYGYFQLNEFVFKEERREEIKKKLLSKLPIDGIDTIENKLKFIVGFYQKKQLDIAIEEMSELTKELCKFKRGRTNIEEIKEETADVLLMLKQIMFYFNFNKKEIDDIIKKKIERTIERMDE